MTESMVAAQSRESPLWQARRVALGAAMGALNAQTFGEKYSLLFPVGHESQRAADKDPGGLDARIAFYIGRNCVKSAKDVRRLKDVADPAKRSTVYGFAAVYAPVVCAKLCIEELLTLKTTRSGVVCDYLVKEAVEKRPAHELQSMRGALLRAACAIERQHSSLYQLYERLSPLAAEDSGDPSPLADMPDSNGKAIVLGLVGTHGQAAAALQALRMLGDMQDTAARQQSLVRVLAHLIRLPGVVDRSHRHLLAAIEFLQDADARATLLLDASGAASARVDNLGSIRVAMVIMALLSGLASAFVRFPGVLGNLQTHDPETAATQAAVAQATLLLAVALGIGACVSYVIRRTVGQPARDSFRVAALKELGNYASLRTDEARSRLLRFTVSQDGGRQRVLTALRVLRPAEKIRAARLAFDENDEYYRLLVDSAEIEDYPGRR